MSITISRGKFSEALYSGVVRGAFGAEFRLVPSDCGGKVEIWAPIKCNTLRERVEVLEIRNSFSRSLQSLGFSVETELRECQENPYERSLACTMKGTCDIVVKICPESIGIGLASQEAPSRGEFMSVRRSIRNGKGGPSGDAVAARAMRTVEAMVSGESLPMAISGFLFEQISTESAGTTSPACGSTLSHGKPVASADPRALLRIQVPQSGSPVLLERLDCYGDAMPPFGKPAPTTWRKETGEMLIAFDLRYSEALELVEKLKGFLRSDDSQVMWIGGHAILRDGAAASFRSSKERARDNVVREIADLGFECYYPIARFSASRLWADVYCDQNLEDSGRVPSEGSLSRLGVLFGRDETDIECGGEEFSLPHASAGGFGEVYARVKEICRLFWEGRLDRATLAKHLPSGSRRNNDSGRDELSDVFGVGDYIGDGLWMTAKGPADLGR